MKRESFTLRYKHYENETTLSQVDIIINTEEDFTDDTVKQILTQFINAIGFKCKKIEIVPFNDGDQ